MAAVQSSRICERIATTMTDTTTAIKSGVPDMYVPTPDLSDADGKTLLDQLHDLYFATEQRDPGTGKELRRGSADERYALAKLKAAMIAAGVRFARHADFRTWLRENSECHPCDLESYDPVFDHNEMSDQIRDLKAKVERLQRTIDKYDETLLWVCLELSKVRRIAEGLPPIEEKQP